jgi:hypothetical protein
MHPGFEQFLSGPDLSRGALRLVPFGWDPEYLDSVNAGVVVCQTAERFMSRAPRLAVNVRSLARETIAKHRAVTEERIFRD